MLATQRPGQAKKVITTPVKKVINVTAGRKPTRQVGEIFMVDMDGMNHGKRPVLVVAVTQKEVTLMPLTTRTDATFDWDVTFTPNQENGLYRECKTSPDFTQIRPLEVLNGTHRMGKVDANTMKVVMQGFIHWLFEAELHGKHKCARANYYLKEVLDRNRRK